MDWFLVCRLVTLQKCGLSQRKNRGPGEVKKGQKKEHKVEGSSVDEKEPNQEEPSKRQNRVKS